MSFSHGKGQPVLYAFDLLWLDGEDLRQTTLLNRKSLLAALIHSAGCERILRSHDLELQQREHRVSGPRFAREKQKRQKENIRSTRERQ
jgi:ATP-dependent DNA ligase